MTKLLKKQNLLKSRTDIIDFGIHKGKTVEDVLDEDPTYVSWLINKTDNTQFNKSFKEEVESKIDDLFSYRSDIGFLYY